MELDEEESERQAQDHAHDLDDDALEHQWQEQQEAERQADLAVFDEYQDHQDDILMSMSREEYQDDWWQEQQEAERLADRENSENQDRQRQEQQEETKDRGAPGTGPLAGTAGDQADQGPGTAVSRLESPENPSADDVHPRLHHAFRLNPDVPAEHGLGSEGAQIGAPGSPTLPNQEHGTAPVPECLEGQRA